MDAIARSAVEILRHAIEAEENGHVFYLMAAQSTADEQGRQVFQRLAREELEHKQFLTAQYKAVLQTGLADPSIRLGSPSDLSGDSPIFSAALRARLKDAHFEMTALSIGIQLEANAVAHYREAAQAATDPAVRAFFEELAAWETGHYQALLRQQQALKEDFWAGGGFSPF